MTRASDNFFRLCLLYNSVFSAQARKAGRTLNGVLATQHGAVNDIGGACALPEGSYTVTTPVALGNIPALKHLAYRPGLCGHILSVNCGSGPVEIVVANCNLGGGLDLYGSSWKKATRGKPPGRASCSLHLTNKNSLTFNGPRCYCDPNSEKYNDYSHLIGVFNTNGRIVKSATLDGRSGSFNGMTPYFAFYFGPVSPFANVVFTFEDRSSHKVLLKDCLREDRKHGWS